MTMSEGDLQTDTSFLDAKCQFEMETKVEALDAPPEPEDRLLKIHPREREKETLESMLGVLWIPGDRTSLGLAIGLFATCYVLTMWALHFAMKMLLPVSLGIFVRYMLPFIQDGSVQMCVPALRTFARAAVSSTTNLYHGLRSHACLEKWRKANSQA